MEYKVPQDVQREDTIIGPITLRQLIILGIGGGGAYAVYVSLAKDWLFQVWLPPVVIIVALTLAFAFLKIHSLEFHVYLMHFIEYKLLPHKRIWIQGADDPFVSIFTLEKEKSQTNKIKQDNVKMKNKSIKELTELVNTYGKMKEEKANKHQEIQNLINHK